MRADRFCEAIRELTAERQTRTYAAQWVMVHSVPRHVGISDGERRRQRRRRTSWRMGENY